MTIYLVAGEASGDEHGAALMRALRALFPGIQFQGRGGPKMKAIAGESFINWTEAAAVVGLWEVVRRYGYFREQFQCALREIARCNPNAVILIDYPGFNLRLARALRKNQHAVGSRPFRGRIVYYISPQVWAWNRGRIEEMARLLDLMLCIFPFEAELYNRSGLRTVFVGHPMVQHLAAIRTNQERQRNLIGLFPGSRLREIRTIFPVMLKTAEKILSERPETEFEVAAASEALRLEISQLLADTSLGKCTRIVTGDSAGTMQRVFAGIVASGTATLEAAFFRLPFVLVYKVSWPTYFAARLVLRTPFLGMPNILANREIVPEFLQQDARPSIISRTVLELMSDENIRQTMTSAFDAVIAQLGETGASEKAARVILDEFSQKG